MTDNDLTETLREIESNIEQIERTWRRYGLPALVLAWFAVGVVVGVLLCGWLG